MTKITTAKKRQIVFEEPWSITTDNDGYGIIYIPREFGAVFSKNTKYDRCFVSFKSRKGAENFLLKHGAKAKEY